MNDARHIGAMNGGFLHGLTSRMGTEPPFKRYDRPEREADEAVRTSERIKRRVAQEDKSDSVAARWQRQFFKQCQ